MLTELRIRNLAVIESVTLPVAPGFNVLSGETGAGKSIIVGALGLLLGERSSADVVRTGADKAVVEGVFDGTGNRPLQSALDEKGIESEDGLLVLRREVSAAGKSRAWINDVTVTTTALATVGRLLVNLHGQHESQALLHDDAQRDVLDALAGATETAAAVRNAHAELESIWSATHKTILFVTHDIDEALYLGEKVYVMSARPGRIIDTICVEFPHPRSYELSTEPSFVELKRRIQHSLHAEVRRALAAAA